MSELNTISCPQCGAEVEATAKFCSNCGSKVEQSVAEPVTTEEVVVESAVTEATVEPQDTITINYETENQAVTGTVENTNSGFDTTNGVYNAAPVYQTKTTDADNKGMIGISIGSLVCGILSLLCCCTGFFGILLAIAGIVLGIVAVKCNYAGKGMAIAGIVISGIGLLIVIFMLILATAGAFDSVVDEMSYYM